MVLGWCRVGVGWYSSSKWWSWDGFGLVYGAAEFCCMVFIKVAGGWWKVGVEWSGAGAWLLYGFM